MQAVSPIDLVLTVLLVVAIPGYKLARSIARRGETPRGDRVRRYQRAITTVAVLGLMVATIWIAGGRPVARLGLGAPGRTGWIMINAAIVLVALLVAAASRAAPSANPKRNAAADAMMPVGRRETIWFLGSVLVLGAGWEVLYRGYLLWALAPMLGVWGAVPVLGLSYGLAHGYRGNGALVGSVVSALLFAGGYALTLSLWWLIVIHIGLPLAGLAARRRTEP